jgi:hypothetical protein
MYLEDLKNEKQNGSFSNSLKVETNNRNKKREKYWVWLISNRPLKCTLKTGPWFSESGH